MTSNAKSAVKPALATTKMNTAVFTSSWWDSIYWISQLMVALAGALALISGRVVNNRQANQIAETNERASKAEESANKLRVVVAEAEQKRAEAEKSLLKLQQSVAQRTVTQRQKAEFKRATEGVKKGTVRFLVMTQEAEVIEYAMQIMEMFSDAGFDVGEGVSAGIGGASPFGINLRIRATTNPFAEDLCSALLQAGIETEIVHHRWNPRATVGSEAVDVIVGNKKLP